MNEIASYYKVDDNSIAITFNLAGHSRGCQMIAQIAEEKNFSINKAILIGGDPRNEKAIQPDSDKNPISIYGENDLIFPASKLQKNPQRFFVNTGHLGLLSHPDTLERCYQELIQDHKRS